MTKTQIPLVACAIFSISLLLIFSFMVNPVNAQTTIYAVSTGTASGSCSNDSKMEGEEIGSGSTLIGESFNKIQIPIKKQDVPTGNVLLGIWNSTIEPTDSNYKKLIATISVDDITTSFQTFTFQFSPAYNLTANEIIGIFYENTTCAVGRIDIGSVTPSAFDGTNTRQSQWTSSWGDLTTRDVSMTLINTEGEQDESLSACIDTNLDGSLDLCFNDTNNDGIPDNGLAGSLGAFQSNANVTQMGQTWFCAFNIGDACTNDDAETNGVGVFYLLILIIFSYAFLVAIHLMAIKASNNNVGGTQALMIHPILLLVMLFVDTALAWYLNFIPDVIFYSILVLMVGLGGFGVYKVLTKDN